MRKFSFGTSVLPIVAFSFESRTLC